MLTQIIARLRRLVTLIMSIGLIWLQSPIATWAQTTPVKPAAPKTMLLQQANDNVPPQAMTEADRAKLKDPFFQLVLKDHADATTLSDLNKFLKPADQEVFAVDEHMIDGAAKVGDRPASRRSVVTMSGETSGQVLDKNVMLAVMFNSEQFPTANFLEAMGWDESSGSFNYYKFDKTQAETAPTWKFRGNSKDADLLSTSAREGTCMQCHINGAAAMKELLLPWNNWDSFSAKTPYLSKGNSSWPIANAVNSPLTKLSGAESLESGTVMPSITRFNERQINRLISGGQTVTDARRLLKPLFVTTEFNLISSPTLSPLHPFAKGSGRTSSIDVPGSFFLNNALVGELDIPSSFDEFANISSKDYEHLIRQTKTTLAGQPGDSNFAWFVPEASFIDNDWVRQLVSESDPAGNAKKSIVPKAFIAAALAVDLENPVLSKDRAKLWSDKILPAQFKFGATNDLIPQVVKNLEALKPAAGTPEATFLQILRKPETAVATLKQRVEQYVSRERNLLGSKANPADRSREWIRLYKLALQRREAILNDPILKSLDETGGKLLLARGDVSATVAALPSTLTVVVKPRPTLRLGSTGEDVVFLQQRLKALGFLTGSADGDFGPRTQAAVIAAQRKLNLTADGIVGNGTWTALQSQGGIA
jgi:Putative peptidoglycan binding domain